MKKVTLSAGKTAYTIHNPEASKTVVLLHGGTIPSWAYDDIVEKCKSLKDFKLVLYDMYGRGESDAPQAVYNKDFYVRQLSEFLNTLQINRVTAFVGSSFGASIATLYSLKNPNRVRALIYISPAINWKQNNPKIKLISLPFLGKKIFNLIGKKTARQRALSFIESLPQDYVENYKTKLLEQFDFNNHGFWNSFYSQITEDGLGDHKEAYKNLGEMKLHQFFVISGDQDQEVPLKDIEFLKEHFKIETCQIVPGATHGLVAEQPELTSLFVKEALSTLS